MANKTANTSGKGSTSGNKPKTGKRRMRKQIRKTLGGLFLASAIVVAAIPVESTRAQSVPGQDYAAIDKDIVRAVHYSDSHNNSYEAINGQNADTTWQSKVPYINTNEQVYVDETMTYQFAFVKEDSASTDYYAVILGAKSSAVDSSGSLTIPDTVDAYYAYASNTSSGRFSYLLRRAIICRAYRLRLRISILSDLILFRLEYRHLSVRTTYVR